MHLTIISEPTSNKSRALPRTKTLDISESEAAQLIERDLASRRSQADDPSTIEPRTAQEVITEIGSDEVGLWRNIWRQDRKSNVLCSYEVWNAHGNQDHGAVQSVEDELIAREEAAQWDALGAVIRGLIANLPSVQREVFIAVEVEGRLAVDVAAERGVSKAAISKTLTKARARLQQGLFEVGVNSARFSGFPLSDTNDGAQEGKKA